MRYDIKLVHGTYETIVTVHADDDEQAIAKARARAKRDGFYCLPMAYERETIVSRGTSSDD
jgi:hypothetical protein